MAVNASCVRAQAETIRLLTHPASDNNVGSDNDNSVAGSAASTAQDSGYATSDATTCRGHGSSHLTGAIDVTTAANCCFTIPFGHKSSLELASVQYMRVRHDKQGCGAKAWLQKLCRAIARPFKQSKLDLVQARYNRLAEKIEKGEVTFIEESFDADAKLEAEYLLEAQRFSQDLHLQASCRDLAEKRQRDEQEMVGQ